MANIGPIPIIGQSLDEIFSTLVQSERKELKLSEDKLQEMVPPPLHSAMEKQDPQEAKTKYHDRQQKQVELVPPTCTSKLLYLILEAELQSLTKGKRHLMGQQV